MSTSIDQKAYLQKYLSGPSKDKKKKKKRDKKTIKGKGFKIIDDDLDLSKLRALETDELDIYGEGEDAPQVAGIIDERPEELRKMEQFQTTTKWRVINQDDGFNSKIEIEEVKQSVKETEKENEIIFGKMYSDSEDEQDSKNDGGSSKKNTSEDAKNKSKNNDSDESPPRKRSTKHYDSDESPPRKNPSKRYDDASPERARIPKHHESIMDRKKPSKHNGSDESPPRKNTTKRYGDVSQQKKRIPKYNESEGRKKATRNNDSDESPPRKNKKYDSDASPPRKMVSKSDESNEKKKSSKSNGNDSRKKTNDNDYSHQRKATTTNYDSDASPPRRKQRSPARKESRSDKSKRPSRWGDFEFEKNEVEMISQEYEKNKQKSASPKKDNDRRRRNDKTSMGTKDRKSDSDLSPPRKTKRNDSDSDLSPPRRNNTERDKYHASKRDNNSSYDRSKRDNDSPPPTNKRMAKTLEGKLAGLQDARQLRQENESFRRREDEVFNRMGDEVSGRNAKAVSRKGKRDTSEDRTKQREKAERQKEIENKYKKWSKGLKQIEDHQERMADFIHEASKPLARHQGDSDLEGRLKGVERQGDPMLQYIRERKREKGQLPPERPSYKGSFPPNRFNIRPGYRWDGVDRSNGYEKKYFDQQSKRKAQEMEAYKWSTEDL